jgi:hypothetical protein
MMVLQEVVGVVQGEVRPCATCSRRAWTRQRHKVAQYVHVTHQIDEDEVRNAMMVLQEVVGVVQGEVRVHHFQGEHGQLHEAAQ